MTDKQAKLEALRNYATAYEAVVIRPDGQRCLLAYCGRHSKQGLADAIAKRGEHVARFLGVGEDARMTWKRSSSDIEITGGGIVRFSGRTQRDAIMEGALPYVANA